VVERLAVAPVSNDIPVTRISGNITGAPEVYLFNGSGAYVMVNVDQPYVEITYSDGHKKVI